MMMVDGQAVESRGVSHIYITKTDDTAHCGVNLPGVIAQLGEQQTEVLEVPSSILGDPIF